MKISRGKRKSQTKHNKKVLNIAKEYKARGYKVKADNVPDFNDPIKKIGGFLPDLIVNKNGHVTVIEVETPQSVNLPRDIKQRNSFKSWSKRKNTRHYRTFLTD